ncbi:MAG TPA: TIGR00730 family Rossman fold protein [Candidatus Baltobacteraceae bacterium]|nr:TIGR00730 family Rossman fold protein [Candidatus Baltobacteraceae bacterium]
MAENRDLKRSLEKGSLSDQFGWRIFRIMAEFVDGFELIQNLKNTVSFFGSARFGENDHHYKEARELAKKLGKAGYTIVTGGGPGIMEAGNRGAMEAGAASIGLNIQLPTEQALNSYTTRSQGFHYFFTRKVMLSFAAQAYVFFPGGFGTLNELTELLMLVQTRKIDPLPIILVGKDFWRPFIKWVEDDMLKQHEAIDVKDLEIFKLVKDVDEAFEIINSINLCPPNASKCWYGYQAHHVRGAKSK